MIGGIKLFYSILFYSWSMRRDVMYFVETKWPALKKLCGFW